MLLRKLFILFFLSIATVAYSQQDVTFSITSHLLPGTKILKVKRDYYDPYVWVLAQNNGVYRINSLTLAVDNYTASFSAYNNLQFIDIAGRSQDTVFVAANSPDVIEYNQGALSDINAAVGLADTVTSLGMADENGFYSPLTLHIATTHGLGSYNVVSNSLAYNKFTSYLAGPAEVFTETYRSELLTGDYNDDPSYYPTVFTEIGYGGYDHDIVGYVKSGSQVNTAYYVPIGVANPNIFQASFFWGNKNGLWQEWLDEQNLGDPSTAYQYLNGINVNKVTDILGLASLPGPTNPYLAKDNLLIGTDQGFYFSNSLFANLSLGGLISSFSLTYFSALGNLPVYDVCVNATATSAFNISSGCENGVWLATSDGVYLLAPDYGAYLSDTTTANVLQTGNPIFDSVTNVGLCQGSSITPRINSYDVNNNSFQWEKNGQDIVGATQDSLVINSPGEYYVIIFDPCENVHIRTNKLRVNSVSSPVFSFNYPPVVAQCGTSPYTLNVTYNSAYHYRWYTNGALNGDTTSTFIATQSGQYYVEVSACTNSWVPSSTVRVDMITLPTPNITPGQPSYCAEDTATLSANIPADTSYTISWFRNDTLVVAGNGLPTLKTLTAGTYTVMVTSHLAGCTQTSAPFDLTFVPGPVFQSQPPPTYTSCGPVSFQVQGPAGEHFRWYTNGVLNGDTTATFTAEQNGTYYVQASNCPGAWVSSNSVQITVINLPSPSITADKAVYCSGENAVLTENVPVDPSYTINWYQGSTLLTANTNQTSIITNVSGSYSVEVVSNVQSSDGSACSEKSATQVITINPAPTVSIAAIPENSFCDGQTVELVASFNSGSLLWSTGETSGSIKVTQSGAYKVTVTSAAGCQADTSITVTFLASPVFTVSDTSICEYKRQPVTLTAPAGFAAYSWNGQTGGQTYTVTQPGTVSLTITGADGCQATQQIKVADVCAAVYIPNTFTPNGDGVNDTWVVEGLDATATVQVFTRWGKQIYQSVGYPVPWNGEYDGKKLPQGVYYYVITAKNNTQKLSGWVSIIY